MTFTGAAIFYWGVFDFEYSKQKLIREPALYKVGMEGSLFNTKVFWGWNMYALVQSVALLYLGMVFTQESAVASGKSFTFWAGGHIVYFECILLANLVLLRQTHNHTGWFELLLFLQTTSFFWILYLDTIIFTKGVVAYFYDEFMSSSTAWLGCLLVGSSIFIEKAFIDTLKILKKLTKESASKN